jgi:predicted nuclease of restriction endonuclease-like (RecB) superfamily
VERRAGDGAETHRRWWPKTTAMTKAPSATGEDALFRRVVDILEAARGQVARSVNTAMVQAYWLIGREIVQVEQRGARRAGYGDRVMTGLAGRLATRFGRGFSQPNLRRMRRFFLAYSKGSALQEPLGGASENHETLSISDTSKIWSAVLTKLAPSQIHQAPPGELPAHQTLSALPRESLGKIPSAVLTESPSSIPATFPPDLGWTHYLVLMRVSDPTARAFYEIEAVREGWSSRELERQVASLLFERLAKSRDKDKVLALARTGQHVETAADVIKDPLVLEFLDLGEKPAWRERDLEQAIIDRIEAFLLELGKGFCFVARQKRVTVEGDHFYVDLVFYNRLLRSFVLVDLKLGKLAHQDLGQMQMYVNFFDRFQRAEHEAATIGIVLCSEKNDAMAKITLPEDNQQILAARYQMYLPTEDELRAELARKREEAERTLRLLGARREKPRRQRV